MFEGAPDRSVYNPLGAVHGGYAATLLDSACGIAVHSALGANRGHTTLELKISYLRGLSDRSGTVRATGRAVSVGRRVAFADATLHDGEGRLCATATSTLLVFDVEADARGALQPDPVPGEGNEGLCDRQLQRRPSDARCARPGARTGRRGGRHRGDQRQSARCEAARGRVQGDLALPDAAVLGNDLAGTVVAVGTDVRRFKVGDEVFARPAKDRIGTFAERIAVAEADIALKPASLDMDEAAALPLVALTAWQVWSSARRCSPARRY